MDFSVIDEYIDGNVDSFLSDLSEIIKIKSKRGIPAAGRPFGEECAEALAKMRSIADSVGFKTVNHENYMLECDYNDQETALGVIAHLDVVPEGDGWNSDPFELTVRDGVLCGRGVIDDKGPAMAAFYAFKALKETGVTLSKNARLLFGSDEESGMSDLEYYQKKTSLPPMMLSPDGAYPVINVEKGVFQPTLKMKLAPSEVVSLSAGRVVNAVPDLSRAVVKGVSLEEVKKAASSLSVTVTFETEETPDGVKILAFGASAHGSTPQKGDNSLTALLLLLTKLPLPESDFMKTVKSLVSLFPYGESDGTHMGLKMEDSESGPLTALLSVMSLSGDSLTIAVDVRFPATVPCQTVEDIFASKLCPLGFEFSDIHKMEGHLVPAESDFIKTLLSCYEDVTGQKGTCVAEAGATYLHNVEGGVAYGAEMPGDENNMHGANEHVKLSNLTDTAKIYARAIYYLCK